MTKMLRIHQTFLDCEHDAYGISHTDQQNFKLGDFDFLSVLSVGPLFFGNSDDKITYI